MDKLLWGFVSVLLVVVVLAFCGFSTFTAQDLVQTMATGKGVMFTKNGYTPPQAYSNSNPDTIAAKAAAASKAVDDQIALIDARVGAEHRKNMLLLEYQKERTKFEVETADEKRQIASEFIWESIVAGMMPIVTTAIALTMIAVAALALFLVARNANLDEV